MSWPYRTKRIFTATQSLKVPDLPLVLYMWTSKGCPELVPIRFIDCLLVDTLIGLTPLTKLIGPCFSSQHSAISTKHRKLYNQHNTSRVQKVKCCVKRPRKPCELVIILVGSFIWKFVGGKFWVELFGAKVLVVNMAKIEITANLLQRFLLLLGLKTLRIARKYC